MEEVSYVVVFPTVFSKNKIPQLIVNIKKILTIQNQEFKSVKRDGDIILVDANDPVFSSSAINLLFGIEKIAIARQIKNDFPKIVSEIATVGGNLLLKGEKFFVKVEGSSIGFFTKDVEIAATSAIIGKKINMGASPGTEERHDKLLYTYLTKNNAYICIFSDDGQGGIPFQSQNKKAICSIYDEISAISCFQTIKQGYDSKIIICYRQKSELLNLAKVVNQIIPRLITKEIVLEFFHVKLNQKKINNYPIFVNSVLEILLHEAKLNNVSHLSLALSPMMFSTDFIDYSLKRVFQNNRIPIIPLTGIDSKLFEDAKEIGLEKQIGKLEKLFSLKPSKIPNISNSEIDLILESKQVITVKIGPNNVHDILDSLE